MLVNPTTVAHQGTGPAALTVAAGRVVMVWREVIGAKAVWLKPGDALGIEGGLANYLKNPAGNATIECLSRVAIRRRIEYLGLGTDNIHASQDQEPSECLKRNGR